MGELKAKYPKELGGLSWDNWTDPRLQIRALVLKDRDACRRIRDTATQNDNMLMCMAAYNGGVGGLNNDRTLCRAKPGCNPGLWYGHVEHTSYKSRTVIPGYGKSPMEINREYVYNIDKIRRPRYLRLDLP